MFRRGGDGFVHGPDGTKFWGRFGAAGLLVADATKGVLLQHRAHWSHFGGTWALPGGARQPRESDVACALREADEEAGVPSDAVAVVFTDVLDLGFWHYTTVVARARRPFEPVISDPESLELAWVPFEEVTQRPLHPAFAGTWERLADRVRAVGSGSDASG